MPFRCPLKVVTVPTPEIETFDKGVVTPTPTKAVIATPTFANLELSILRIWSPPSSITQTFKSFPHSPGVFAAYAQDTVSAS